jgi:D-alanyl-D-alanine carboxypeptidase/D-alanyl-D-alanine-endopeptidase (penicillin-binding protein 4)
MKSGSEKLNVWFFAVVTALLSTVAAFGQSAGPAVPTTQSTPRPLLQDIQVVKTDPTAGADSDLVKKTSSVSAVSAAHANSSIPSLADIEIPGTSGVLVESLDGTRVVEYGSNAAFNPASNVKIATAYAVLKTFGPDYRFPTNVWTDGVVDPSTGVLNGNLYISGRDPIFSYEHAVLIANGLNRLGIRSVQGDLVVTDDFAMSYSSSTSRTSQLLFSTLDASKRNAAATRAWLNYLSNSGTGSSVSGIPSVTFTGASYVQPLPSSLRLLFTHESAPIREIVKATLCYSNNFLAERLGDMLGGPQAVARVVQLNAGIQPTEFYIQTSSGLGINRVTPAAMMKVLRSLRKDLGQYRMTFRDIMPVAGLDQGTLEERFDTDFARGSVVGKTGTLGRTDGGASALSGEINTRNGRFLFVIFNQRGSVARFRNFQNYYVSLIQGALGGAAPFNYAPIPMDTRLAKARVVYPNLQATIGQN